MSWQTLVTIYDEQKQELDRERAARTDVCPYDGELLESAQGVMHCPFCGRAYS